MLNKILSGYGVKLGNKWSEIFHQIISLITGAYPLGDVDDELIDATGQDGMTLTQFLEDEDEFVEKSSEFGQTPQVPLPLQDTHCFLIRLDQPSHLDHQFPDKTYIPQSIRKIMICA